MNAKKGIKILKITFWIPLAFNLDPKEETSYSKSLYSYIFCNLILKKDLLNLFY